MSSNEEFPILNKKYALHRGVKYSLVYQNRKIGSDMLSIIVNRDAARIIYECNGKNSLDQIIENLAFKYNENSENLKDVVKSFIMTNDYLDILDEPKNKKIRITGSWDLQIPRHVSIELTYYCNFKCRHCYNKSAPQRKEYIDRDWLLSILEDLKKLGVDLIEFTGGEPLTHPNFEQILNYSLKLFSIISIITNGYFLTEDVINLISEHKDKINLQISLYGSKSSYVDWFSGKKGAFERSKRSIKLAAHEGIFVTCSMIVTPLNIDELYSTVKLAKSLGASSFRISNVVPIGRADIDQFHFSPENIQLLTKEITLLSKKFGDFIFETPEYLLKPNINMSNCGAGTKAMTITPDGDVKICPLVNTLELYLGNLHHENIESILSKNEELNLFEIKDPRHGICGECGYLWFCEGCIARGSQMYSKIGTRCYWGNNYFINFLDKRGVR